MDISTFNSLFCEHGEQVPNSIIGTEKDMIMVYYEKFQVFSLKQNVAHKRHFMT